MDPDSSIVPYSAIRIVDASSDPRTPDEVTPDEATSLGVPIVAVADDLTAPGTRFWLDRATVTLTTATTDDRRAVTVADPRTAAREIARRVTDSPITAATCDDVLRAVDPAADLRPALIVESLAYSTLQAGPEFARWLASRGPSTPRADETTPLLYHRDGDTLHIEFHRPRRHNAFNDGMRALLIEALNLAHLDPTITAVEISGAGKSFCSGGDLADFGGFDDPASAHLARTRHSPALGLFQLEQRLGTALRVRIRGQVLGSGLEMAAFCGTVRAHPDTVLGLPELSVGLVPGAGGMFSVPRRIGRHRTAYLLLSGETIDAPTAHRWGLVDEIG
ncbi:enoyl-CoA hydratase/isomerase family protein [Gordonia pseudamarae]|uniref:enoyl-CoA hydratase/isomerase family protein n=1 Tax=Gordonia pseudamarae TaxID=2831662 RepID=UPI001AFB4DCC|nr:enoyl-CoA hydratase/isomerase family protein [Gordonia pseudamarae]QHN27786.1 enoyl-CoA hydratase/isomerase family protein [Gordonia pseudamarae]